MYHFGLGYRIYRQVSTWDLLELGAGGPFLVPFIISGFGSLSYS